MKAKHEGYEDLERILNLALEQSAIGKGRERHANHKPWKDQPILTIQHMVGSGFALGQAIKKIQESTRLQPEHAKQELLGALVYISGAILHLEQTSMAPKIGKGGFAGPPEP